ncbi:hypothetical protein M8C13_06150 [Crossiella sp. SN42]|uniref:hypothetical protein n=1 Tax=Crossiella sp. SN42 TaxID=2944808 RepID=UPI00207C786F|nr:hypothetical protein [Crossiella sp. SN42]MCO1575341.1 hypothetical protein [Crossiella sp. SN42]
MQDHRATVRTVYVWVPERYGLEPEENYYPEAPQLPFEAIPDAIRNIPALTGPDYAACHPEWSLKREGSVITVTLTCREPEEGRQRHALVVFEQAAQFNHIYPNPVRGKHYKYWLVVDSLDAEGRVRHRYHGAALNYEYAFYHNYPES